ncbi:MAG TPA: hypothetical protein VIE65_02955 [Methylobacter sp.]|jgi:hypothetical protein
MAEDKTISDPANGGDASKTQYTADYIAQMVGDIASLAKSRRCNQLVHLLGIAEQEAKNVLSASSLRSPRERLKVKRISSDVELSFFTGATGIVSGERTKTKFERPTAKEKLKLAHKKER